MVSGCLMSVVISISWLFGCGVSARLPVGYGSVEYLVGDFFDHLRDEFFLYGGERDSCLVCRCRGELPFEIFVVVDVVRESHVDRHRQLCLRGVSFAGDAFVALLVLRDFTFYFQVSVAFHLLQPCVVGKYIFEFVVEDGLHGSPNVA